MKKSCFDKVLAVGDKTMKLIAPCPKGAPPLLLLLKTGKEKLMYL